MASHGMPRASATTERSEQAKQQEAQQIKQYRELVELVDAKISERQYTPEVLELTSKLLKQNPEYYTIWNHRRRILQHGFHESLQTQGSRTESSDTLNAHQQEASDVLANDLRFILPLLMKFPKCYWIWNHRLWLLHQSIELLPATVARQFWQEELGLVSKMLNRDSRNFHGWNYRRIVVAQLESLPVPSAEGRGASMVEEEFEYTTKMIRTNLSNFSAWHNRSKLIPRLLAERNATEEVRRDFLRSEFKLLEGALYTDPYDQSLWFYHGYLMRTLEPSCPKEARIVLDLSAKVEDEIVAEDIYEEQLNTISDMLDGAEDCKWIYEALLKYSLVFRGTARGRQWISIGELEKHLDELRKLDPLRAARWDDLQKKIDENLAED
ncbi:geranylgeranyl transferas-like protein type II alpha subunit [Saccharata proteae CBS 121410]|uniref:Geranylgeranyl transferase type-2 subunit alpha n=1 Tax=Saccharata proteae CBS 121410 TaxID=1314787 RepID=A0A9P4HYQ3_9PEZI|nr:geranylgeranyl transferas-like protein type II alpha subunit [Saccharata proteae CBS 121410]